MIDISVMARLSFAISVMLWAVWRLIQWLLKGVRLYLVRTLDE
jgi:hypothetical protein